MNHAPRGLSRIKLPREQNELLRKEAVSIFTAMTAANASLQQALVAVYLSGMNAAYAATKGTS